MATAREYGPITAGVPNDGSLVGLVRGWANRDSQALPDGIIMDGIRYAVDTAYRTLRIPPLEHTVLWTDTTALAAASGGEGNIYQSYTALSVPPDLIEFIHIRGTDANGLTTRVFNEKSDIRSFWDICNRHYDQTAFWSRQGDQVLITPSFGNAARGFYGGGSGPEAQIEMYYYRRLPALNATFEVTPANANLHPFGAAVAGIRSNGILRYALSTEEGTFLYEDTDLVFHADPASDRTPIDLVGEPVPNWFKDENEKIVLYGALAQCFAYLQEDDQSGKYLQLMQKEIDDLNDEDRMRDSSGGNVQVQYTARGLI